MHGTLTRASDHSATELIGMFSSESPRQLFFSAVTDILGLAPASVIFRQVRRSTFKEVMNTASLYECYIIYKEA